MNNVQIIDVYGNSGEGSGYRQAVTNMMDCFEASRFKCNFYGTDLKKCTDRTSFGGNADINFLITAPPYTGMLGRYNIGYFYWETDSFPRAWHADINRLNELWAPCQLVANCAKKIGFNGKIKMVPTPMRKAKSKTLINFSLDGENVISEKCFKFYSIFQWQYRKGYDILLRAYLEEFKGFEDVVLVLKINPLDQKIDFKSQVKITIKNIKASIGAKKFPPIVIADSFFSNEEMDGLHNFGDCFVLPHRGEGWGMPIAKAMLHDNHIMTTKFGGVTDYLSNYSAHIIKYKSVSVSNMEWCGLYNHTQNWAEPNIRILKENMRELFENEPAHLNKIYNYQRLKQKLSMEYFTDYINRNIGS